MIKPKGDDAEQAKDVVKTKERTAKEAEKEQPTKSAPAQVLERKEPMTKEETIVAAVNQANRFAKLLHLGIYQNSLFISCFV